MTEPMRYPNNDDLERRAIDVLNYLLDPKFVKADIKKADKVPNHDGEIEIVDDRSNPVGKFNVQVKKMPEDFTDRYGDCPTALIEYSQRIEQPLIFIGVDNSAKKAYWMQITQAMAYALKPAQKTFTLVFDPGNVIEEGNSLYLAKWRELLLNRQRDRAELPRLKHLLAETLGLESIPEPDKKDFLEYIERINILLTSDFDVIREEYFPGVAKLGMAIVDNSTDSLVYHYYAIGFGVPAQTLISLKGQKPFNYFETQSESYLSEILGQEDVQTFATSFTQKKYFNFKKNSNKFVLDFVELAMKERIFQPFGVDLCLEEIFVFLDRYASAAGLAKTDFYNIEQLNDGIRQYLPVWFDLSVNTVFSGSGVSYTNLDCFDNLARVNEQSAIVDPAKVEALKGKVSTPLSNAISTYKPIRTILSAIDYLSSKGIVVVERPYERDPTGLDMAITTRNIIKAINSSAGTYKQFVEGNRLKGLVGAHHYSGKCSNCFVADTSTWSDGLIRMTQYYLHDPEQTLPQSSFFEEQDDNFIVDLVNRTASVNGRNYGFEEHKTGFWSYLSGLRPLKNLIYSMLAEDLAEKYGLRQPHRFNSKWDE